VCLSVCLSVCKISQNYEQILLEIFGRLERTSEQLISFDGDPDAFLLFPQFFAP